VFHHHHSIGGKIIAISDTDFATQQNAIPPRTANRFPASPSVLPKVFDGRLLAGIVRPSG
jgi:hypothetical protein